MALAKKSSNVLVSASQPPSDREHCARLKALSEARHCCFSALAKQLLSCAPMELRRLRPCVSEGEAYPLQPEITCLTA